MKFSSLLGLIAAFGIAACGSNSHNREPEVRETVRESFLKDGPSLALEDVNRLADPTTLQLLSDRTEELEKLRKRVSEIEADASTRNEELAKLKEETATLRKERERMESLLVAAADKERAALERSLAAEAARLRMEQDLLRSRLGKLVKDR